MDTNKIGKETKTINVNGQEFKISFISTYTHLKVKELNDKIIKAEKLLDRYQKLKQNDPDYENKATQLTQEMSDLNNSDVISQRLELVKHVLEECNDIKYDEKFWTRKTRISDINNFLYDCLHKDWDKKKVQ